MAGTRVTKRDRLIEIREVLVDVGLDELIGFIDGELELNAKRSGKARGLTATQKDNEVIKDGIVEALTSLDEGVTATDVAGIAEISVQKATQLLKQLVDAGRVTRTDAKGKVKATFAVA